MTLGNWPGFDGIGSELSISCQRAIYGKVDGARSDYRWIAASEGFRGIDFRIFAETSVGQPSSPAKFVAWKAFRQGSDTYLYAAAFYPSRARDAAGRVGVVGRHILEARIAPGLTPALAAALMLPAAVRYDESEWFNQSADPRWKQEDFHLLVDPLEINSTGDQIRAFIDRGVTWLRANLPRESLVGFYATLLSSNPKSFPFLISGIAEPAPPEALAALLLVLTPEESEHRAVSLCGWIPADSAVKESFAKWHLVFANRKCWNNGAPPTDLLKEAEVRTVHLIPPPEIHEEVRMLIEFAHNTEQRWLRSGPKTPVHLNPTEQELLSEAKKEIIGHLTGAPEYLGRAAQEVRNGYHTHVGSKLDVFSAAWFVLDPNSWKAAQVKDNGYVREVLKMWSDSNKLASTRLQNLVNSSEFVQATLTNSG